MKKLISILLILSLLAALCACGKQVASVEEQIKPEAAAEEVLTEDDTSDEPTPTPEYSAEELASLDPSLLLGNWVKVSTTIDGVPVSDESGVFCALGITQDVTANFAWTQGEDILEEYGLNIEFAEGQLLDDCPMPWYAELKNSAYDCTYQLTLTGHDSVTLIQHRPLEDGQGTREIVVSFCRVEL